MLFCVVVRGENQNGVQDWDFFEIFGILVFFRIYLDLLDLCFGFLGVFFLDFFF